MPCALENGRIFFENALIYKNILAFQEKDFNHLKDRILQFCHKIPRFVCFEDFGKICVMIWADQKIGGDKRTGYAYDFSV